MDLGNAMVWDDGRAPHVAVVQEFAVDQLTPISAFAKLRPLGAHTLLESVEGDQKVARFSFVAVGEWARLKEEKGRAILVSPDGLETDADPLRLLREQMTRVRVAVPESVEIPFVGGAIGYFAYDWIRRLERLPEIHPHPGPIWEWVWPTAVVAFDHLRRRLTLLVEAPRDRVQWGKDRLAEMVAALKAPLGLEPPDFTVRGEALANLTREQYRVMVDRAKAHIYAGDIFQVVLSQRLTTEIAGDPLNLYRRLRHINPSPYLFYLETAGKTLIGASPEALLRVSGRVVENRPIAGTRPRGASEEEDAMLWEELIHDPKERAEHTMLVDLARNDLGRVSEYGSVAVKRLMVREAYSHVMHIVSEVQGRLWPGMDALDALAASFPAGTLTGAPKIRAMEIIEELEPEARGAYGGVVGYLSHRGDLDACITIRTIEMADGRAWVQAGGGIVADSDPDAEYQESLNKAAAALKALAGGEGEWL